MTTPKSRALKKAAGQNLRGCFGKSVSAFIITVFAFAAITVLEGFLRILLDCPYFFTVDGKLYYNLSAVSLLLILGNLLLVYMIHEPLKLSLKGYFLNLACQKRTRLLSLTDTFSTFRGYRAAFALSVKLSLLKLFWIFVLFVPVELLGLAVILLLKTELADTSRVALRIMICAFALFNLLELFLLTIIQNRYFLAPYLLISNNAYSSRDALKKSKALMKGNLRKVYFLHLSYLGQRWLLVFLLPAIFIVPIFDAAKAELAKNLMFFSCDNSNKHLI